MAALLATGLKSLFCVLGCLITASVTYTIVTDGFPFRKELLTPWMAATLIDFYIHIVAMGAWIVYKESKWISAISWMVLLVCLGSITTCFYIVLQFLKLSRKESEKSPIYHVLHRHKMKCTGGDVANGRSGEEDMNIFSVATARLLFSSLGCLMLGTLIYTIVKAGSPFDRDIMFPWLSTTLIDFYINVMALLVWVTYKESSWIRAPFWIILFISFGSISTCAYIVLQLYDLDHKDPVNLILFNDDDRVQNGHAKTVEKDSNIEG